MKSLADRQSIVGTIAQSGTRIFALVRHMRPTWHLDSLNEFTPEFVRDHGIAGVIWDVDGTLTAHHASVISPEVVDAFARLRAVADLRHVIASNANDARFHQLGSMFPDIPVIRASRTASGIACQRLLHGEEKWFSDSGAVIARPTGRVLRKPDKDIVRRAVSELHCASDAVVMIGDQYLTDIAGAALAGIRSIKLPTIARASFPRGVRVAQRVEQFVYAVVHGYRRPSG